MGENGFPFFAQPMYEYLCVVDPSSVIYLSMMSLIVMQHCCYKSANGNPARSQTRTSHTSMRSPMRQLPVTTAISIL